MGSQLGRGRRGVLSALLWFSRSRGLRVPAGLSVLRALGELFSECSISVLDSFIRGYRNWKTHFCWVHFQRTRPYPWLVGHGTEQGLEEMVVMLSLFER